jgi:hypothetical protein
MTQSGAAVVPTVIIGIRLATLPGKSGQISERTRMADELAYAQGFAELSAGLLAEREEQPALERVVALAVETIESSDYCSISIRTGKHGVETPASTDEVVLRADGLQYRLGEGPGLDAIWTSGVCLIDDLVVETRWPQWAREVAESGIRSVLSVRIHGPEGDTLASLNLYARRPGAFDETDLAIATIFARHAGLAIYGARQHSNFQAAIQSRQLIGAAQGILMQRFGLNLDQSFELLRRYSQTHNVKLRLLAEHLVQAGRIPTIAADDESPNASEALTESLGLLPSINPPS